MEANTTTAAARSRIGMPRLILAVLVVLLHPATALSILFNNFESHSIETLLRLLAMGYSCAAISITAIWTVAGRFSLLVCRVPLTGLLLTFAWFLVLRVVDEPVTSSQGPGWAALVATQYVLVVGLFWCFVRLRKLTDRPLRFSLTHILSFLTLSAIFFGCIRLAVGILGWTEDSLAWEYFFYCPIFGVFNALAAATVVFAHASRTVLRKALLGSVGVALAVLLGILCYHTLILVFDNAGGLEASELGTYMGAQAVCVWITVLPFWHWPRWTENVSPPESGL